MSAPYIIYGGSGGIGSATARLLHARGYPLHLVGRDENRLVAVAEELGATYTAGDVTDHTVFGRVSSDAPGPWAGLVYAVGTINLRSFGRMTESDFMKDFQVNALGAALAVQAAVPALKQSESPASVVLFSTVAASQGFSFHTSMGMAKGAVNGLTLSLAAELAPKIRVNAIAPSLTRTPLAAGMLGNEKMAAAIAELHPLQRLGDAEDVANLAAFLVSPEAGWITGQIMGVDGGRSTLRTKN
ncbi:MAG: SDR family oxidoreductase [Rhodothermales bacterium]|nr:SDR family oxidoreductase [Rhodothermales bacterium]